MGQRQEVVGHVGYISFRFNYSLCTTEFWKGLDGNMPL
jgi:hypothetical protein